MYNKEYQKEMIKLTNHLRKRNIRTGFRQFYWLSVTNPETGESYREYYLNHRQCRERAIDLALEIDKKSK